MREEILRILEKCKLCEKLTKEQVQLLLDDHSSLIRTYEKGEFVFHEGDVPEKIYILISGRVEIGKDTPTGKRMSLVNIEQQADMFGEVYLFLDRPHYDMHARAQEKSVVLSLAASIFQEKDNTGIIDQIQYNLMSIFARKAYAMNGKLRVLSSSSIREKIVRFLFERQDQSGIVLCGMTREDMADYLSVTRPSLSRELGAMQKEGILHMDGKKIIIKDQDKFESYL